MIILNFNIFNIFLLFSSYCECGDKLGKEVSDRTCSIECEGDNTKKCGGGSGPYKSTYYSVYGTGK